MCLSRNTGVREAIRSRVSVPENTSAQDSQSRREKSRKWDRLRQTGRKPSTGSWWRFSTWSRRRMAALCWPTVSITRFIRMQRDFSPLSRRREFRLRWRLSKTELKKQLLQSGAKSRFYLRSAVTPWSMQKRRSTATHWSCQRSRRCCLTGSQKPIRIPFWCCLRIIRTHFRKRWKNCRRSSCLQREARIWEAQWQRLCLESMHRPAVWIWPGMRVSISCRTLTITTSSKEKERTAISTGRYCIHSAMAWRIPHLRMRTIRFP